MVNGKSVSIISLSDSDQIQIGPFELWFYDSEPTEDMPAGTRGRGKRTRRSLARRFQQPLG